MKKIRKDHLIMRLNEEIERYEKYSICIPDRHALLGLKLSLEIVTKWSKRDYKNMDNKYFKLKVDK